MPIKNKKVENKVNTKLNPAFFLKKIFLLQKEK